MIITVFMNVSRIEALNPTEAFVWLADTIGPTVFPTID
jgi:hypothetical protein